MAQTNSDYSKLKTTILEGWVPAVGMRSAADLWINLIGQLPNDAWKTMFAALIDNFHISKRFIEKKGSFKREFNCYFDKEPPFQVSETFMSGSWSDGLFLFGEPSSIELPDMDFMCVLKNITFSQEDIARGNLLLREDTPFVHVFITDEDKLKMWNDYLADEPDLENKQRLSSMKLKEKLEKNYEYIGYFYCNHDGEEQREGLTEGAAITIHKPKPTKSYSDCFAEGFSKFGEPINETTFCDLVEATMKAAYDIGYKIVPSSDIVLSIFCEGWPSCAREWITRQRLWPDIHSVEKITQGGFYIVPKSSADGDFRLSFSCAETMLMQTLSPLQHKIMRAFKAAVKYNQNTWSQNLKGLISSYHLKTIAFSHFEKTTQSSWTEETMVHHLVSLLEELAEAARLQKLPMYFMPKFNLFQECDNPEVALELMEKILQITRNYCALSVAIESISLPRYFKAREHELKTVFEKLNAEHIERMEKEDCTVETNILSLWKMYKTLEKCCKNRHKI